MGVNPAKTFSLAECYNCGVCTTACPDDLLTLGIPPSPGRLPAGLLSRLKRGVSLGLGVALLLIPAAAYGHHMRGKPHYGYAENYPQIPTRETRVRVGSYDITVVSYFFEGLRRQTSDTPDDVQFYVSLTDSRTGQSYTGPLTIEVRRGKTRLAAFTHDRPFEEAVYRVRQSVPGPGLYDLRLVAKGFQGSVSVEVWGDTVSWMPYAATGGVLLFVLLLFFHRRRTRAARRRKTHVASGA